MEHRFQVFVSSTFSDLKEERAKVAQAIIDADCFPAGMETFPASGDEQFEYIKKVIDESDYYVLIIAGRYGSTTSSGVSYTELEFNYAMSAGLPILVFPHGNPESIPSHLREDDPEYQSRLSAFRERAMEGRLAKMWTDADALANQVMRSLLKISRESPGIGWLRASGWQLKELQDNLEVSRSRVAELESKVSELEKILSEPGEDLSAGDDEVSLSYRYWYKDYRDHTKGASKTISTTWNDIFRSIGPELLGWRNEKNVSMDAAKYLGSLSGITDTRELEDESMRTLRIQFMALNLVEREYLSTIAKGAAYFWRLTDAGKHLLFQLRPVRKG